MAALKASLELAEREKEKKTLQVKGAERKRQLEEVKILFALLLDGADIFYQ